MTDSQTEWKCTVCTSHNPLELKSCGICRSPRNQWICSVCTYTNISETNHICEMCGQQQSTAIQNASTESTQLKVKIQTTSMNESEENPQQDIANNVQIFKYNKCDVPLFGVLLVMGSIPFILGFFDILYFYHTLIAFIGYFVSITMAVLLNSDDIPFQRRIKILGISYLSILLILSILSMEFVPISTSAYITLTSLLSSWIIVIILFVYEYGKNRILAKTLKYSFGIKSLIVPVFTHFADIATDFGVTYEYYVRSQSNDGSIDYNTIFEVSLGILLVSRLIGTVIIWYYTQSILNSFLQLFDLYIIKTLGIEWKLKYKTAGRVHQYIALIESIFESGPQSIISVYILIADHKKSVIIWISSVLSILSVAARSISQDNRYFTAKSHSNEHGWSTDNGVECNKSRCLFCNYPYLLRVLWRLIDVTSFVLFCGLLWYYSGITWLLRMILLEFVYISSWFYLRLKNKGEVNIYWFNSLLVTQPNSWDSTSLEDMTIYTFAIIRYSVNICILYELCRIHGNNAYLDTTSALMLLSVLFYVYVVGRQGIYGSHCCCNWNCGDNWIRKRVVTNLSIAGCDNMEEIMDLKNEGIEIKHHLKRQLTWQMYPRPNELVQLVQELNYALDEGMNYLLLIATNRNLDPNISKVEMKAVIRYLKRFCDINRKLVYRTPIEWACICEQDKAWIDAFVEEGAVLDPRSLGLRPSCLDLFIS